MKRIRGLARGISRVIAVSTAIWSIGLLSRAVENACALAGQGVAEGTETGFAHGTGAINGVGDIARFCADVLVMPSMLAVCGLAAVALGSIFVIVRSRTDRAGATFAALAIYGGLALSRAEFAWVLDGSSHTLLGMVARIGLALGGCALAWRWIEDIALAASLEISDDPHAIDARTDLEAARLAKRGPSTTDNASRRLQSALKAEAPLTGGNEPGLHGRGSPIPRVLPDQDRPVGGADGTV
jgi:hypothetical protein